MAEINLTLSFGRNRLPVRLIQEGPMWWVEAPYSKDFVYELKGMTGARWHPGDNPEDKYYPRKGWTIDICKHNSFAFEVLMNSPRYQRYLAHLPESSPSGNSWWKHQVEMWKQGLLRRRHILGAEPRTGKTRPTLQIIKDVRPSLAWFVTTKSAELGIFREISKWYKDDFIALDTVADRSGLSYQATNRDSIVLKIMTYDAFTSTMAEYPAGVKVPQFVVFDEIHKLKTPDSARSEQGVRLSDKIETDWGDEAYIIGLSGTPAPKNVIDWWQPCEIVRPGYLREGSIGQFRKRYGIYKPYDPGTPAWQRFEGWNLEEVSQFYKRVKGLVSIYLQKDCLDIPALRYEVVELSPSKEILRVAQMISDTEDNCLRARNRLRQLSDGFEYDKEFNNETLKLETVGSTFLGSPKIEALKNDLEEMEPVGRIVVYAAYRAAVDIIRKTCLDAGWTVLQLDGRGRYLYYNPTSEPVSDRESLLMALGEMDRSTDTGAIEKLAVVAQTDSAGTGMEFSASPLIVFYSNSDSGEGRMQAVERGHSANMDKVRGCTVKDYIHLPTDALIREQQMTKKTMQSLSMGDFQRVLHG